ncbi:MULTISPECIES: PLDc N-terminal domain-containing protein [Streptomyces]|nr:SHOCT domain-containing protein [Streptomyces silvensis]
MEDYPLLDVFWTMLMFFLWIMWFLIVFHIIVDIFRNEDLSGLAKAGWLLFVLVVPLLGVAIYLIVQGKGISRRTGRRGYQGASDLGPYPVATSSSGGDVRDLERLAELHRAGALSQAEFEHAKHRFLAY